MSSKQQYTAQMYVGFLTHSAQLSFIMLNPDTIFIVKTFEVKVFLVMFKCYQ